MAQGFDVTQSLFGNVLTPEQQATSAAMQQAQLGGLGGAEFQAFRAQESARQQIPKIFGQQSEEDIVKDVRNKNLPILQSQGKLAYLDAIIADFAARGLGNKAFLAQQLKDQVADAEQKRMADLGLTAAQTTQAYAAAEKSGREAKPSLSERLVTLDTKKATQGLNSAEEAERASLEKTLKIQAPKGTNIDLGKAFSDAEQKKSAEASVEAYNQLGSAYVASSKTLRDIDTVDSIIDDTFRGGAANLAISASKLASAAGVNIPKTASNSEVVQALFGKLVIPLVKQFPGALAVKELEALQKTQPQLLNEPETIKRLLALAKQDLQVIQNVYTKAAQYKKSNNDSTKGFDFNLETGNVYGLVAEANALTPQRVEELRKTEEGKKKLAELKPFLPRR